MGLLDRLLRGRRPPEPQATGPLTPDQALARWRYLVRAAPPEVLSEAHGRGLETLEELPRAEVLQRLRSALSALEPGVVVPADPAVLLRASARAERRAPGFLERALASDARGRQGLTTFATAVVGTSVAAPFLQAFDPDSGEAAFADRRSVDHDVDSPDQLGGHGDHDEHDDIDDED
jgi:hypothetical protein